MLSKMRKIYTPQVRTPQSSRITQRLNNFMADMRRVRGKSKPIGCCSFFFAPFLFQTDASLHTISPAPRPHPWSDDLHRRQKASLATATNIDMLLIGDSMAQLWPLEMWFPWTALNLGIGGFSTQHVLGLLEVIDWGHCRPERVLIVIGTNNLLAGDSGADIAAGAEAIVLRLAKDHPDANFLITLPPPLGTSFRHCIAQRQTMRTLLSARFGPRLIDADTDLIGDIFAPNPNYEVDLVHLSTRGYEVFTRVVRAAL